MNERLWTVDDLKEYFTTSKSTLYRSILCKEDFPEPSHPEGFGKRWFPEDVKKWALKQKRNQSSRAARSVAVGA